MQITISLTDSELAMARGLSAVGKVDTPMRSLMRKVAAAVSKPVKVSKLKATTAKLWQALGRPDLKTAIVALRAVTIGGEKIVSDWGMAEGFQNERCGHCGAILGQGEAVTGIGDGMSLKLAHKACGWAYLADHGIWQTRRVFEFAPGRTSDAEAA